MGTKKRVLLGMSGGVDSSVAAILLQEQGYEVIGITMKLWEGKIEGSCCSLSSTLDAKRVCDYLQIPHYTLNFKKEFKQCVIHDFIEEYRNARTPNPCIECNKYLKFGAMYQKAKELECDFIATGHYAKIEQDPKDQSYMLKKARAVAKDQSYVLYNLPFELLGRVKLVLGDFTSKEEIREIARKHHLPVANKPDSEDICFIPDGNYKKFLEEQGGLKPQKGNIVTRDGKILGTHTGLYRYTIGQRKGLGISNRVPLFVLGFNPKKNELIVGEEKDLYQKECLVEDLNILRTKPISNAMEVEVKIRYSTKGEKAKMIPEGNQIRVIFEKPVRAITLGQSAVFYQGDCVIGGGKIKG